MYLHLGGPGSDAIIYLIQYPAHVLFLAVDGHIHLDDIPPGKRFLVRGRKSVENQIEAAETARIKALGASAQTLLRPTNKSSFNGDKSNMPDWRLGIRMAAVLLACESRCAPAFAQDQSGCASVRFARGATSVTIRGKTTLDGADCYTFRAAADQDAHLRVSGENAFVSVIDVGNTRNGLIFKTKLRTYKFVVRQIGRVAPVEPYNVVLSIVDDIPSSRPLDGTWEFDYSCAGATGPYFDRCRPGERDDFTLSIAQIGARFCGSYELTAQMGNHVDDGGLSDWAFTTTANQTYRVHFHVSGRIGEAAMRVDGKKLHWKVLTEHEHDEGEPLTWSFMPPSSAIMDRKTTRLGLSLTCNE